MLNKNAVLQWEKIDEKQIAVIKWIDDNNIPEYLNGESGMHIYHVRMLTELIYRQLKTQGDISISEEEIEVISIASSLHDIGKSKVPKSILDFPGKISSIEYDIIKKHAAFGEAIVHELDFGDTNPKICQYAAEIARSHHERYDGTGYPDGLKGDEIPLSAQVVSLADAYDALTSNRSYKAAFSRDVAIQMISSGMCGVFQEKLIDALLKVVNHSSLEALRNRIAKQRSVVEDSMEFIPKRVLLIGNTQYLNKEFIEHTFPESKVTVIGNIELDSSDKIKRFCIKKPSVRTILETYDFDLIIFFSGGLSFMSEGKDDSLELNEVLKCAGELQKNIKFIFLSSLDSAFSRTTDRSIRESVKEKLCEFYAAETGMEIKIVQIPWLYSGSYKEDFLYQIFEKSYHKEPIWLEVAPKQEIHFISMPDLTQLLMRLVDNWKNGSGVLAVVDEFHIPFADLAAEITKVCGAQIALDTEKNVETLKVNNKAIRSEYGWVAGISLIEDLEEEYEKFLVIKREKVKSLRDKTKLWMEKHSSFMRIFELIVLFLFTEVLLYLTDSAVIFSVVDFRMAYIVIMATVHGLNMGLAAAGLSCVSWLAAKVASGTNLLTIFYEPTNWLPFVFFILVGALCGYTKLRKDDTIRFVTEQNQLLEEKLIFIREVYEDTYLEKKNLKKQIVGAKDSFGKIFDITRKLDTVELHLLYLRIMETFEEILGNKTLTVYSINKQKTFGRLEVASRDIIENVSKSISTETYAPVIEKLNNGEIWRNIELKPELPMYASGVYRGKELVMLIFLWHANLEQQSLYYANLFKILCDLVQMSLLRVFDYNQAISQQQYIENTHILNARVFEENLQKFKALAEKKVSSYVVLEFEMEGRSYQQMEELLLYKVRANDILGAAGDDKVRILFSGAGQKDLEFILPRFENTGLKISVIQ